MSCSGEVDADNGTPLKKGVDLAWMLEFGTVCGRGPT